jgi:hypothetical protein
MHSIIIDISFYYQSLNSADAIVYRQGVSPKIPHPPNRVTIDELSRSDADHGNVAIPLEALSFLDRWLESKEARDAGIRSRRDFVVTVYGILQEKVGCLDSEFNKRPSGATTNITIPRQLSDQADNLAGKTFVTKALWLPRKTNLLSFVLHNLLAQQDTKYAELVKQLTITSDDIRKYKMRKTELKSDGKAVQKQSKEVVTVDYVTFRCSAGNHLGCSGIWQPEIAFPDELVICTCRCHNETNAQNSKP